MAEQYYLAVFDAICHFYFFVDSLNIGDLQVIDFSVIVFLAITDQY